MALVFHYSKKSSIRALSKLSLILVLIIYIVTVAKTNFRSLSYIKDGTDFDRLGKDIIDTVPPGSLFFAGSDNANFAALYQVYEGRYAQKAIFFQLNFLTQEYYLDQLKAKNKNLRFPSSMNKKEDLEKFILLNKKKEIYLETPPQFGFWMPYGLLWKYYGSEKEGISDISNLLRKNTNLWKNIYHIPELTSNTRNIFHLQSVQDFYLASYLTYAKLLYYAQEYDEAKNVLRDVLSNYKPSNRNARVALMNLLLLEKNCKEARVVVQDILRLPAKSLQVEFISPIVNFYEKCDTSNKDLRPLKSRMKELEESSLTPLDHF